MDPVRRWQAATAVTALAGLGLGAALLNTASPPQPVEPIELDLAVEAAPPLISLAPLVLESESLVSAEVREDRVTPHSPVSVASADEPVPSREEMAPAPAPAPAPNSPAPADPDSGDSPDSDDSLDSDD